MKYHLNVATRFPNKKCNLWNAVFIRHVVRLHFKHSKNAHKLKMEMQNTFKWIQQKSH